MRPVHGLALIGAVVALFVVAASPGAQAQRPTRQAFEYNIQEAPPAFDREERFNRLGAQGWELATASGSTYVFKRPR